MPHAVPSTADTVSRFISPDNMACQSRCCICKSTYLLERASGVLRFVKHDRFSSKFEFEVSQRSRSWCCSEGVKLWVEFAGRPWCIQHKRREVGCGGRRGSHDRSPRGRSERKLAKCGTRSGRASSSLSNPVQITFSGVLEACHQGGISRRFNRSRR